MCKNISNTIAIDFCYLTSKDFKKKFKKICEKCQDKKWTHLNILEIFSVF